jgi:ubiquinone/menaquinone biosynthesis C-methylase UbiE
MDRVTKTRQPVVAGNRRSRRASLILFSEGHVEVRRDVDRPTGRWLFLEGMEASYVDLADAGHLEFSYVRRIRDAVDAVFPVRTPLSVVHIGGGGGTYARYVAATRTESRSELIEVDPVVVDVARRHLGLQSSSRLKVHLGDARARLVGRTDSSADVVVGDAFIDGLVPAHLATTEFTAQIARVLAPDGVYVLNVVDAPPQYISRRIAATLLGVFPQVALVASHRVYSGRSVGNLVLIASGTPVPLDKLRVRAARDGEPTDVIGTDEVRFYAAGAKPFTDEGVGYPGDAPVG